MPRLFSMLANISLVFISLKRLPGHLSTAFSLRHSDRESELQKVINIVYSKKMSNSSIVHPGMGVWGITCPMTPQKSNVNSTERFLKVFSEGSENLNKCRFELLCMVLVSCCFD